MTPFTIGKKRFQVESSWHEVTLEKFFRIREAGGDFIKTISVLSGIAPEKVAKIEASSFANNLLPHIEWVLTEPNISDELLPEFLMVKKNPIPILKNLGHGTFAQKLIAQRLIRSSAQEKDRLSIIPDLLAVYLSPLYYEKPFDDKYLEPFKKLLSGCKFTECLQVFDHFLADTLRLLERDNKNLNYKPSKTERRAGIDKLSKFGNISVIKQLLPYANNNIESVMQLEYDLVFKILWYEKSLADFHKRYNKIKYPKSQKDE